MQDQNVDHSAALTAMSSSDTRATREVRRFTHLHLSAQLTFEE